MANFICFLETDVLLKTLTSLSTGDHHAHVIFNGIMSEYERAAHEDAGVEHVQISFCHFPTRSSSLPHRIKLVAEYISKYSHERHMGLFRIKDDIVHLNFMARYNEMRRQMNAELFKRSEPLYPPAAYAWIHGGAFVFYIKVDPLDYEFSVGSPGSHFNDRFNLTYINNEKLQHCHRFCQYRTRQIFGPQMPMNDRMVDTRL